MRLIRRNYTSPVDIVLLVINLIFGVILFLVAMRILLLLLGANSGAGFVQFIYNTSEPFVAPFQGIFPNQYVGSGSYLDSAAILAFVIYGLLATIINSVLGRYGTAEEV